MKGLLIKEAGLLKSNVRTQLFSLVLFAAMGFLLKNPAYTGMMVTLLITNLTYTSLSYDESCCWNRYVMTMPVRRKDLVSVKYVLLYLLAVGAVLFTLLLGIPMSRVTDMSFGECAATAAVCGEVALLVMSINVLLCIKLGVEKARILVTLTYLIPMAILFFLYYFAVMKPVIDISRITEDSIWLLLALILAVVLAVSALCWLASCRIMEKKDL